jgi:dTDP-4-amino-4,6-dideoxygalactose transaminase
MKAFKEFSSSKLNFTEKLSKGIFSLPMYPELKNKEIKKICRHLKDAIKIYD